MPKLHYNNQTYTLNEDESVLECLLRHQINYPNACRAGICQACLIKTSNAEINPKWQANLPDTLKSQGYFLACQARKCSCDLSVQDPDASECEYTAKILEITPLTYNVIQVKLMAEDLERWTPGQYLNLLNPQGIARSYSIANIPAKEGFIELHIKLQNTGVMSHWFKEKAAVDETIHLRGPFGKCYYLNPERKTFDMLLAGTGTGLAPLIAIVKQAIDEEHVGKITLVHGGCIDDDIYYVDELQALASHHQNFNYSHCVLKSQGRYSEIHIAEQLLAYLTNTTNIQLYICGPKEMTNMLKMKAFLAGVSSSKIYSDAFL